MNKKIKDRILNTSIKDLNIDKKIDYLFKDNSITLKEFFDLNKGFYTTEMPFVMNRVGDLNYPLAKKNPLWKRFSEYLANNGFNHNDWLALLPTNNISLLKTSKILELPFYLVAGMKYSCDPMIAMAKFFLRFEDKKKIEDVSDEDEIIRSKSIKVREVLKLTPRDIEVMIENGNYVNEAIEIGKRKTFRLTMANAQKKLVKFGFKAKHGKFMSIMLFPEKDEEMALYIHQNRPLSLKLATKFVFLAKMAKLKLDAQSFES